MAGMIDEVGGIIADAMSGVQDELRALGRGTLGQDERKSDAKKAWRKLKLLPHDQFRVVSEHLAQQAGHTPDEEEPCDFHAFMNEMIGK